MPERGPQFDYPEEPWSKGKMRMAKTTRGLDPGKEYRELEGVRKEKESKASELTPDQWQNWRKMFPQGQLIGTDHPQLAELSNTHDFYTIPDKQYEKYLFLNPKPQDSGGWQGPGPTGVSG